MSDDLVKRLRELAKDQDMLAPDNTNDSAELREAADRIETLKAALQPFADPCIEHCFERCESECDSMEECPCFIARATLAGENHDDK